MSAKYAMIFEDHDDGIDWNGVGSLVTLDDFDGADDLPVFPPVPRPGWWSTTESEEHHLDLPTFTSGADRAAWMVERMARAALAGREGVFDHDPVFPTTDGLKSLHELLRGCGGDAVDAITSFLDRE